MGHVVVRAGLVGLAALAFASTTTAASASATASALARLTAGSDGRLCTAAVHSWSGLVALEPGASFHTGEIVPAQTGVELDVGASDVSTDAPAPGQLALWIGDIPVVDGATVVGGEITATNTGADTVTLTRVEISIDECSQVEVAPQPVPHVPDLPTDLPATGAADSPLTAAIAVLLTGAGAVLLVVRRRPRATTASGRGR